MAFENRHETIEFRLRRIRKLADSASYFAALLSQTDITDAGNGVDPDAAILDAVKKMENMIFDIKLLAALHAGKGLSNDSLRD